MIRPSKIDHRPRRRGRKIGVPFGRTILKEPELVGAPEVQCGTRSRINRGVQALYSKASTRRVAYLFPQTDVCGPASIHMSRKPGRSSTDLRDLNRCRPHPGEIVAHRGFAALVASARGEIVEGIEGFFLHQTRFLSRFRIEVDDKSPRSVSAHQPDHHSLIAYYLAPTPAGVAAGPEKNAGGKPGEIVRKAIEIHLNAYVGGGLHFDIFVTNHALAPTEITLAFDVAADFADLDEAASGRRRQNADVKRDWTPDAKDYGGQLELVYQHPRLSLGAALKIRGGDSWRDDGAIMRCRLALDPQQPQLLSLDLHPRIDGREVAPILSDRRRFRRSGSRHRR